MINIPHLKLRSPLISFIVLFLTGTAGWGQPVAGADDEAGLQNTIRLQFRVALKDQVMLNDKALLLDRVATANQIYKDTLLRFEIGEILPMPEKIQDLISREDRNSLAENAGPPQQMIQIFVVNSARDVDKLDGWIAGVHWRYSGAKKDHVKRRYIILSSIHSNNETLAHELGHWFGLNHEKDENNLMCGTAARKNTVLHKEQIKTLNKNRKAAVERNEIVLK